MSASQTEDQQHPRESSDREIVNRLLSDKINPLNLAELARLRIRYHNFPGARQLQRDLDLVLQQWQLTEEQLFVKTRELHANGKIYKPRNSNDNSDEQDWS